MENNQILRKKLLGQANLQVKPVQSYQVFQPISSLEILQPNYQITSTYTFTDSESHVATFQDEKQMLRGSPFKNINKSQHFQYSNSTTSPSIENIVIENQRKEEAEKIPFKIVDNLQNMYMGPQFSSVEINSHVYFSSKSTEELAKLKQQNLHLEKCWQFLKQMRSQVQNPVIFRSKLKVKKQKVNALTMKNCLLIYEQ